MGKRSRDKGKRREREAAAALRALGIDAHRGRQYHGSDDAPDVRCAIPGAHIEVKGVERLNLGAAMKQARADAGWTQVPIVLSKRSREPWLLTVQLEDLRDLWSALDSLWRGPVEVRDAE